MRHIRNVEEMREAIKRGEHEFRLCLNGGVFSRKTISLTCDGCFKVLNGIDGSVQKLTNDELYTKSNIGEAMRYGAFLAEDQ